MRIYSNTPDGVGTNVMFPLKEKVISKRAASASSPGTTGEPENETVPSSHIQTSSHPSLGQSRMSMPGIVTPFRKGFQKSKFADVKL